TNLAFDDILVWGPQFVELLAPHSPDQKFVVAGNPNISDVLRGREPTDAIATIGFFLQKGGPLISPEDWSAFLDLISWTAVSFPRIEILIRDHPSTPPL